uniref:Uncharacterized protein n=1 Tax=Panagrellus redivivus TaxID=6233 RepID=A0A7E4ZST7_PANRE
MVISYVEAVGQAHPIAGSRSIARCDDDLLAKNRTGKAPGATDMLSVNSAPGGSPGVHLLNVVCFRESADDCSFMQHPLYTLQSSDPTRLSLAILQYSMSTPPSVYTPRTDQDRHFQTEIQKVQPTQVGRFRIPSVRSSHNLTQNFKGQSFFLYLFQGVPFPPLSPHWR